MLHEWDAASATCTPKTNAEPWKACWKAFGVWDKEQKVCDTTNADALRACMDSKGDWDDATSACKVKGGKQPTTQVADRAVDSMVPMVPDKPGRKMCRKAFGEWDEASTTCNMANAEAFQTCTQTNGSTWNAATATCTEHTQSKAEVPPWKACKKAHGVFNKATKVCDTTNVRIVHMLASQSPTSL